MIDNGLVIDRLSRIREYLKSLRELASLSKEDFEKDSKNFYSASRLLQISIEACLDIGHHIISRKELRRPKDYKDIFLILGDEKIIPFDFSRSIITMAQYRNRLVHLYSEIGPGEIYGILQGPVNDLEAFIKHITDFLQKSK